MTNEIFRFVAVRPAQLPENQDLSIEQVAKLSTRTPFVAEILSLIKEENQEEIARLANAKLRSNETPKNLTDLDESFQKLMEEVDKTLPTLDQNQFKYLVSSTLNIDIQTLAESEEFELLKSQVNDGLAAISLVGSSSAVLKNFLIKIFSLLNVIELVAYKNKGSQFNIPQLLSTPVIGLPKALLPLPSKSEKIKEEMKKRQEDEKIRQTEEEKKKIELARKAKDYEQALDNIIQTFRNDTTSTENTSSSTADNFKLSRAGYNKLARNTKSVLSSLKISADNLQVANVADIITQELNVIGNLLYKDVSTGSRITRAGSVLNSDNVVYQGNGERQEPGSQSPLIPGNCPPVTAGSSQNIINSDITLPEGFGKAIVTGVADLLLVEQELLGYEEGEIAHIENVLKSEIRERKHRRLQTREETIFTETEETEEKEKDLTTTDRFELQAESQQIISSDLSLSSGVTVTAQYGPVQSSANYNLASNTSLEKAEKTASTYAREITGRAVNRIKIRQLERRSRRLVEEIEEINTHSFDNKDGQDNITGIYRWVDKKYKAQVVNYGKRLMLEFVVPEPAAFLRYALTRHSIDSLNLVKPDEPGYCERGTRKLLPLKPGDIDRTNYMFWVAKYGVTDITPPPASVVVIGESKVSDDSIIRDVGGVKIGQDAGSLPPTEGYTPLKAYVNSFTTRLEDTPEDSSPPTLHIKLADQSINFGGQVWFESNRNGAVPWTITSYNLSSYALTITLLCVLSKGAFEAWQLKTYTAIMNAYNDLKANYEAQLEAIRVRESFESPIYGQNPSINRETEKTELKKGCISLLTGQRFDAFDSVVWNAAPLGFPEIDFEEVWAEGEYIQFFEQALDWVNMTYLFYPYYWSNKQNWVNLSQLKDSDPLFARFLQAGAARVQVPVRLDFESAMLNYLETGKIWNAEADVTTLDNKGNVNISRLSLLEELKTQFSANTEFGEGTINVSKGSEIVTGDGTTFSNVDLNRRILINSVTYVIKEVTSSTEIKLSAPYQGEDATQLMYLLGGVLVGSAWEVRVPTSLVKLSNLF